MLSFVGNWQDVEVLASYPSSSLAGCSGVLDSIYSRNSEDVTFIFQRLAVDEGVYSCTNFLQPILNGKGKKTLVNKSILKGLDVENI